MRHYVEADSRKLELAPREAWLKSRIGTDVFFQDWEMYSWGDFRHHCSTETPDEIHETRPNVTGTIFNQKRLQCKDCSTTMPKQVQDYFQATKHLLTIGSQPPMEFYMGPWPIPGGIIRTRGPGQIVSIGPSQFYIV